MNNRVTFIMVSLLAIVLLTLHFADDFSHQGTPPIALVAVIAIIVTWLYGVLTLAGRRSGYIISAVGSLVGLFVLAVHISAGSATSDHYFFTLVLLALGVTSSYSLILAIRGIFEKL